MKPFEISEKVGQTSHTFKYDGPPEIHMHYTRVQRDGRLLEAYIPVALFKTVVVHLVKEKKMNALQKRAEEISLLTFEDIVGE